MRRLAALSVERLRLIVERWLVLELCSLAVELTVLAVLVGVIRGDVLASDEPDGEDALASLGSEVSQ